MEERLTLEERLKREPEWAKRPAVSSLLQKTPLLILLASIFLLYGFFLAHKIDLTTADLGRHIKNGELLLSEVADKRGFEDADGRGLRHSILTSNYYSYTNPDFPVINHHWGSGLLFYLAWKLAGFVGVHLFFVLLSLAALAVFLAVARLYAGWGVVSFVTLLAMPLLAERTEIRPEVWSYLFSGLFFLLLCRYRESCYTRGCVEPELDSRLRGNDRVGHWPLLWLLPLVQVVWVNTHIYFLLGPLLTGAFLLESLLALRAVSLKLLGVLTTVFAASLVNPFGYNALTAAFTLFENFGYRLAENQSVWFLKGLGIAGPNFYVFHITLALLALSVLGLAVRRKLFSRPALLFVALGIGVLAALAVRNFALFGLFLIPILSANISLLWPRLQKQNLIRLAAWCSALALLLTISFGLPRYFPYWHTFGFGLEEANGSSADFLKQEGIRGPYFNDYDIGGYLIFHLFPQEKVFVDNRPEAYPAEFFQRVYIPMQEDEAEWKKALAAYDFNAIVFSHRDATPWAQHFLLARIQDAEWAPVFADQRILILLHRSSGNASLIKKLELPPETFRISR